MADDEGDEEEEEGGGGKKKIIMAVGGLAALGGVYNFVLKPAPPPEEGADGAPVTTTIPVEELAMGEILELDDMILNIGPVDEPAFLRIQVALVLEELIVAKDFAAESAVAKDVIVHYLSSIDKDQLRTAEGRELAKEELTTLVREAYGNQKVVGVLFISLVQQ